MPAMVAIKVRILTISVIIAILFALFSDLEFSINMVSSFWFICSCDCFISSANFLKIVSSYVLLNIINRYNLAENKKFELPHISAHNLRHTGCTRMAEAGMDAKVLQYIMGHREISVTMNIYNHTSAERNRKEMDKLEKIKAVC